MVQLIQSRHEGRVKDGSKIERAEGELREREREKSNSIESTGVVVAVDIKGQFRVEKITSDRHDHHERSINFANQPSYEIGERERETA